MSVVRFVGVRGGTKAMVEYTLEMHRRRRS